jgi:hypothetical protein
LKNKLRSGWRGTLIFAAKLLESLIAALSPEEIRELFSVLVAHIRRVPQSESHIWDK